MGVPIESGSQTPARPLMPTFPTCLPPPIDRATSPADAAAPPLSLQSTALPLAAEAPTTTPTTQTSVAAAATDLKTAKDLRLACKAASRSSNWNKTSLQQRLRDDVSTCGPRPVPPPAPIETSQDDAGPRDGAGAAALRGQALVFTKHEFGRLFHVMALPLLAEAIAASRGPLSRLQKDARENKSDLWETVVEKEFTMAKTSKCPRAAKL